MHQDSGRPNDDSSFGPDNDSRPIATTDEQPVVGSAGDDERESEPTADSEKVSRAGIVAYLMDRFALSWPAIVIIGIVAVLVWYGVLKRGSEPSGGLLGRALRVGIVPWPGYAGGLVANHGLKPNKDSIFWKSHDLFVEFVIVHSEEELRSDLARGGENRGIDIAWSTVDSLAQQAPEFSKEGIRPRAFMQVDWSRGADAIIAKAGINKIEDLRGKNIAVSMPASQWLLEYSLVNSSLKEEDITRIRQSLRVRTSGYSKQAHDLFIHNDDIDAAVLWEPDVEDAIKQRPGTHKLVDTGAATNLIADVMVAKEEFIQHHHKVIKAFIKGWFEGTKDAINDPMLAVKVLMDEPELGFSNLTEQKTRELLGKTALATLNDNVEMFGLSGGDAFFDQLFDRAGRLWVQDGYITSPATVEQACDQSLLKEIYDEEIYDAQKESLAALEGCAQSSLTTEVPIVFPPDKADLSPEAGRSFDDKNIPLLLRTNSQSRFCVEAGANDGDNPQLAPDVRRAREEAVIKYFVERYDRPHSQFVSVSAGPSAPASSAKVTQYIRLRLTNAGRQQ